MDEQTYIKRFNQGYQLAKHEPALFAQITKGNEDKQGIIAMKEGAKQAEREQFRERLQNVYLNNTKLKDKNKGKDLD